MRETIFELRTVALHTRSGRTPEFKFNLEGWDEKPPVVDLPANVTEPTDKNYQRWKATNVRKQKQAGHYTVLVRCMLGDIYVPQMHQLADISRKFCGGRLRTAITQNIVMQWVPEKALPLVYAELLNAGLAEPNAERIADITRCPGADTCQIAITHSKGLAAAITPIFTTGDAFTEVEEFQDIKIKISGCFNSCGQHHIADIGFYGSSVVVDGHEVPHYVMLLGGYTAEGIAKFGKMTAKVPARRGPEAVKALLNHYRENKQPNEIFRTYVERMGTPKIKEVLAPYTTVDMTDPKKYEDLGAEGVAFKMEMGKGECAA
jgi:sulfite reductase (ferredoxin)